MAVTGLTPLAATPRKRYPIDGTTPVLMDGVPAPVQPTPTPLPIDGTGSLTPLSGFTPRQPTPTPNPIGGFPTLGAAPATTPAATGYTTPTAFGPGNDLRGTQINPQNSTQTQQAGQAAGSALSAYTGFQATPFTAIGGGTYAPGSDTTAARSALSSATAALANLPDRTALATGNLNLLNQINGEQDAKDIRTLGANAAKFGRIGSGLTTTSLGDLGERSQINRNRSAAQLALDAASGQAADAMGRVSTIGGVTSLLGGEDRANTTTNQSLRNELRGERSDAQAADTTAFNRLGTTFNDAANYQTNRENQDAANRQELRGERTYQTGQEQTAYDRNRQGISDATAQTNNGINQALALITAGNGGNLPEFLSTQGANGTASAGAGSSAAIDALLAWARSRQTTGT